MNPDRLPIRILMLDEHTEEQTEITDDFVLFHVVPHEDGSSTTRAVTFVNPGRQREMAAALLLCGSQVLFHLAHQTEDEGLLLRAAGAAAISDSLQVITGVDQLT